MNVYDFVEQFLKTLILNKCIKYLVICLDHVNWAYYVCACAIIKFYLSYTCGYNRMQSNYRRTQELFNHLH